jgi:hypothetical protein
MRSERKASEHDMYNTINGMNTLLFIIAMPAPVVVPDTAVFWLRCHGGLLSVY